MSQKAMIQVNADRNLVINGKNINIDDIEEIFLKEDGQAERYRLRHSGGCTDILPSATDNVSHHDIIAMEVRINRMTELLKDTTMVLHAVASETSFKFDDLRRKIRTELSGADG